MALISTVRALTFFSIAISLAQLVRGDAAAGLPGDVARTHAGEDLCLQGGDVLPRPTGG
jgi:hypothetical protein